MIDSILQIVAPHHCYGCGKIGSLLCANCKYDITSEQNFACVNCRKPCRDGVCFACHLPYQKAWYVGERRAVLEELIDAYKFEHVKAARQTFADLLNESLPVLPERTVVVPLPTISPHIRQRGYDHMLLIAQAFAKARHLKVDTSLQRIGSSKQLGSSRRDRFRQAKSAFQTSKNLDASVPYLLLDDVFTTGASLQYATEALQKAGACEVWVAVIARQPLDK